MQSVLLTVKYSELMFLVRAREVSGVKSVHSKALWPSGSQQTALSPFTARGHPETRLVSVSTLNTCSLNEVLI